eukprot:1130039-Karenia_brevis.AAC.1
MGSASIWTFDQKVNYLIDQLTKSTINAEMLRGFWSKQYGGKVSKKSGYFTRAEIIKLIADRLV